MRALILADSDSYLKWAVSRARELPSAWAVDVVVVANAVTPSERQRADAVAGRWIDVPVVTIAEVGERLAAGVDIVVLACRGPLIEFLFTHTLGDSHSRPVTVAGIPGLWYPPSRRGLDARANVDLLVVHSRREREAVNAVNGDNGPEVALATLVEPGLEESVRGDGGAGGPSASRGRGAVIFAPQALVPGTRDERRRLLDALVRTAQRHPSVPVLIKLRGDEGESQTHREFASFPALARELRVERPRNLRFVRGPLTDYLPGARGLVTVSSTAALEAVGAGVPTMVLRDFGVTSANLNEVFEGSGLWGDFESLENLDFPQVYANWMRDNYFHDASESQWVDAVTALVARADVLAQSRDRRQSAAALPGGLRGRMRRVRVRSQALGSADSWWRRWATAVVVRL